MLAIQNAVPNEAQGEPEMPQGGPAAPPVTCLRPARRLPFQNAAMRERNAAGRIRQQTQSLSISLKNVIVWMLGTSLRAASRNAAGVYSEQMAYTPFYFEPTQECRTHTIYSGN